MKTEKKLFVVSIFAAGAVAILLLQGCAFLNPKYFPDRAIPDGQGGFWIIKSGR